MYKITVKIHTIEDGEGYLNEANNEYLRHYFMVLPTDRKG